jgi:hypothetical protein
VPKPEAAARARTSWFTHSERIVSTTWPMCSHGPAAGIATPRADDPEARVVMITVGIGVGVGVEPLSNRPHCTNTPRGLPGEPGADSLLGPPSDTLRPMTSVSSRTMAA